MQNAQVLTEMPGTTLRKISVNPALNPLKGFKKKLENKLSIQGYDLREWLDSLTNSNGIYFLDMPDAGTYSLHYRDHLTAKLMELDYPEEIKEVEDVRKEFLESMLFDLSLFPDDPILVFDNETVEKKLRDLAAIYYEHASAIDYIIGRLVNTDVKEVFQSTYKDSRVKEISIGGIYHALYPGTSISFSKAQGSNGIYLIFLAIQSVFYQITGTSM